MDWKDSTIMKKENTFLNAVRWIIALPLAVSAYFIGYRLFMWANSEFVGLYFLQNIMEILGCGFAAATFVATGTVICPHYRKVVLIVFATIGSIFGIFGCITELISSDFSLWILLSHIANVVGSIAGSFLMLEYVNSQE